MTVEHEQNGRGAAHKNERAGRPAAAQQIRPIALGAGLSFGKGQTILHPLLKEDGLCRVGRGAVRMRSPPTRLKSQILDYLLPGDFFIPVTGSEGFIFEAVVSETVVVAYDLKSAERSQTVLAHFKTAADAVAIAPVERLVRQIIILSATSAIERTGAFLFDMFSRFGGRKEALITLPICRSETAAYLSLTMHSLNRCLAYFSEQGAIRLEGRQGIIFLDPTRLIEGDTHEKWVALSEAIYLRSK